MGKRELRQYVHIQEDEDIGAPERAYHILEEGKVEHAGREVLYILVESSAFTCCDRKHTHSLATVHVIGYITRWQYTTNEKGEYISEAEPIDDEEAQQEIKKLLNKGFSVTVSFY